MARFSAFARLAVGTATLMALSPMLAPQSVMAAVQLTVNTTFPTQVSVGQPVAFSVTTNASGTPLTPTDTYQYHLTLSNSNGTSFYQDLPMTQPSVSGVPLSTGQDTVTNVVYAVYGSGMAGATSETVGFTLTPLDIGSYQANIQLYDATTGTTVGQAVYVPLNAGVQNAGLPIMGPFAQAVGDTQNFDTILNGLTVSSSSGTTLGTTSGTTSGLVSGGTSASGLVYYHVQISHADGTPVARADVHLAWSNGGGQTPTPLSLDNNGVATVGYPTGLSIPSTGTFEVDPSFKNAGTYMVTVEVLDAATGALLGTAQKSVTVGQTNVTFSVTDAQGKPVSNAAVKVAPVNATSTTADYLYKMTDSTGSGQMYLPAGQYEVLAIQDGNNSLPLSQPQAFTVDATTGGQFTVAEPVVGSISGTATLDGTQPAANFAMLLYPVDSNGSPNYAADPIYLTTDASGAFTTTVPAGTYIFTQMWAQSGGVPYGLNQSVTVTQGQTSTIALQPAKFYISPPYDTVTGRDDWHQVQLGPNTTLPSQAYFGVTVTKDGQPVSSGAVIQNYLDSTGPQTFTLDANGTGYVDKANPVNTANNRFEGLVTNFSQPGTYSITYTAYDAATNKAVLQTTQQFSVEQPNVVGTLYAADGTTPAPYEQVTLTGPSGQQSLQTDGSGHFTDNLAPGQWQITGLIRYDSTGPQNVTLPSPVSFTVTQGQTAQPTVNDPTLNVVGVAYEDAGKQTPLANGSITIQSGQNTYYASTSASGTFATDLAPGTYTVTQEGDMQTFNQLNLSFTVGSSPTSLIVAPAAPNVSAPVKDTSGQLVTSGWVGVISQKDFSAQNYNNVQWLPIQSNGNAVGTVAPGSYVAFTVSGESSGFPIDVPFTIDSNNQLVGSVTFAPPLATMTGTLLDASGNPMANASVVLMPSTSSNWQDAFNLQTDANGNFSSVGWNNQGQYGDLVQVGQSYRLVGISTKSGWTPMNVSLPAATQGGTWNIRVPGVDLQGTVQVDNAAVTNGWIAFGPSGTLDTTGQQWQWVQVSQGNYSAILPTGSYQVYGIENDATGQYYNEMNRAQTPIVISITSQAQQENVAFSNNYSGQLLNGTIGVANASIEFSPVANPSSEQDWNKVESVTTDQNGNFSTYLTPGTWYVLGVDSASGYTQLGQQVTVDASGDTGVTVSMTPNVSGHLTWSSAPAQVTKAWLIVSNDSTNQEYGAAMSTSGNNWSYQLTLPSGSYHVLGVDVEHADGSYQWVDLSQQNLAAITASSTPTSQTINLSSYSGTVTGLPGAGYLIFQKTVGGQTVSQTVSIDASGSFSTTLDSTWTLVGFETSSHYYQATGTFLSNAWTVSVNSTPVQ